MHNYSKDINMQTALERKRFFLATFHTELFVLFLFIYLFNISNFLLKMCNKFETVYYKIWQQFNSLQRIPQQSHAQSNRDLHYSKESILSKVSSHF